MTKPLAIATLLAGAVSARAVFSESEPNDTIATADLITRPGTVPFSDIGEVALTAGGGDVDFFALDLLAGEVLTASTTPLQTQFSDPDTVLGLLDGAGNLLAFNDDGGVGTGSIFRYQATASQTYYIGVSGLFDDNFTGAHTEDGAYSLLVGVTAPVPEPASLAALGLGVAALARKARRRNR